MFLSITNILKLGIMVLSSIILSISYSLYRIIPLKIRLICPFPQSWEFFTVFNIRSNAKVKFFSYKCVSQSLHATLEFHQRTLVHHHTAIFSLLDFICPSIFCIRKHLLYHTLLTSSDIYIIIIFWLVQERNTWTAYSCKNN